MKAKLTKNDNIKLTLSPYEAGVLLAIAGRIGGGTNGPREVYDDLAFTLRDLDIQHPDYAFRAFDGDCPALHIDKEGSYATK